MSPLTLIQTCIVQDKEQVLVQCGHPLLRFWVVLAPGLSEICRCSQVPYTQWHCIWPVPHVESSLHYSTMQIKKSSLHCAAKGVTRGTVSRCSVRTKIAWIFSILFNHEGAERTMALHFKNIVSQVKVESEVSFCVHQSVSLLLSRLL